MVLIELNVASTHRAVLIFDFRLGKMPGQGRHQAIFFDGEAIMFKGRTDEIAGKSDARS
jgi:hypothetical protein